MSDKHWKSIGESRFPWEREAVDFIYERFPAQDYYLAWSLFEFIADDGSINEVDVLVVCPQGALLVEIKSRPGIVRGDQTTWTWEHEGKHSIRHSSCGKKRLFAVLDRSLGHKRSMCYCDYRSYGIRSQSRP